MLVRVLVAGVVGAIVSFMLGWIIWGMLLANYFASTLSATGKTVISAEPRFIPLIAAQLALGFFYAFILERWAGARTLASGAIAGAIIGFFLALTMDLMNDAFLINMHVGANTPVMLVDIACATFSGLCIGAVQGAILGLMNKGTAAPAAPAAA
jgi:hypothetical protein